jgi:hypothetical protein
MSVKIKIKKILNERKWNKDSETPRDYSKEYNKPGSKEQEERNKRKRDKRKHDKEHGECPDNQELHHVNGLENDEVACEPIKKNRGRKEKSRLKKGRIVIKIRKNLSGSLNEDASEPTVADFLSTWQKQDPKSIQKIFGKAAKWIVGLGVGATTGGLAAMATGGLGTGAGAALGGLAGASAGKLGEEAINQLFALVASKSGELAKFLVFMSEQQVPDGERVGIANYYDLDDNYEALLQGMDSELANKYQEELFTYFKEKFGDMANASPHEPLKDYIGMTANQYLERYLFKRSHSGVGVQIKSTAGHRN